MGKKLTKEEFIERSKKIHGDKYDYSSVVYKNSDTKVKIFCKKHNSFFEQRPSSHMMGYGCPDCGTESAAELHKKSFSWFKDKANKVHNGKYSYENADFKNCEEKIEITCPIHGPFLQRPSLHLYGRGCPKCAGHIRYDNKGFISKAKEIHGDKYDYSLVEYKNNRTKVKIGCPIHGFFEQTPDAHFSGCGCPACGRETTRVKNVSSKELFIEKSLKIHGNKYDYSKVEYVNALTKVCIICPKHGAFYQKPNDHLGGHGCPACVHIVSTTDLEIQDFIKSIYGGKCLFNTRKIISPKELDAYIPDKNIAIEHTGLWHHSEFSNKERNHLKTKNELCKSLGIKLFTIYSDEWDCKKDIVKSMISNSLGLSKTLYARKTCVKPIEDSKVYNLFLEQNHIQGRVAADYAYGLFYGEELVSVMTFTKPRLNMGKDRYGENKDEIELSRFCCKIGLRVVGGASKLFSFFINSVESSLYNKVYSYSDNRISDGKLYNALGFTFNGNVPIDYYYTDGHIRKRKQSFRKSEFKKRGVDINNKTEYQLAAAEGWYRIYDCGKKKWLWERN